MLIRDMQKERGFTFSCEIFPPKMGTELPRVFEIASKIAALKPDFISVTCGAAGNTTRNTEEIAHHIQQQNVAALAHVTCVAASKEQTVKILDDLESKGVSNVLALRGDLPDGAGQTADGHYRYASNLVADIKARGGFCIGGACYPEGHVECDSQEKDIEHLKQKVDAGCDFLTTQMFFDNNVMYKFLYKLSQKGVDVPVVAGIMPVTNKKQIKRIVKVSGTVLPPRFQNILEKFGDNPAAMQQAGIAYATEQIIDLIANDIKGVHIYAMNRPEIASKIMSNLSHII
jgi:5,10-methylenetetrahydrofolate reductase, prokaryotic form